MYFKNVLVIVDNSVVTTVASNSESNSYPILRCINNNNDKEKQAAGSIDPV